MEVGVLQFSGWRDRSIPLEEELPLDYLLLSTLSEKSFDLLTERVLPKVL